MIIKADYNNLKYNLRYYFFRYIPRAFYPFLFKVIYKRTFNNSLDFKNPKRLSEKIMWNILYDKDPKKTILSDKLRAKEYVKKVIPELNIAKVYQVCSKFEDINFSKAPDTFVIKTNHAWKSHTLIKNKNDMTKDSYKDLKNYYNKVLKINYAFWGTPELLYEKIKPKVYLEEYLGSENSSIKEYEVYCFNGIPAFINYSSSITETPDPNIHKNCLKQRIFDCNWNKANFYIRFEDDIEKPDSINRNLVLEYSKLLSKDFKFVRMDFFEVNNKLFFGEFTFTPYSGFIKFSPEEYDLFYGEKINIKG